MTAKMRPCLCPKCNGKLRWSEHAGDRLCNDGKANAKKAYVKQPTGKPNGRATGGPKPGD